MSQCSWFSIYENEDARLLAEGWSVNTVLLNQTNELRDVFCHLYSAMCKYTFLNRISLCCIPIDMTDCSP